MLGAGSGWLFDSLIEDLLVLAILAEPSLLDWSRRKRERDSTNEHVVGDVNGIQTEGAPI